MNRISIKFNNEEILGTSVTFERPTDTKELVTILEEIVGFLKAPAGECKVDEEPEIELEKCPQCGESAWDGYICHDCGFKDI